jgi:cyclopropane fatty-acyl-phospholipid synthase-like methyltransferase
MNSNNSEIWENIFVSNEWGKYPPVSLVKFVARNFYKASDRKQIKILEIGSGPGANLWFMAREGFTVYGIDFSPTACEKVISRLDAENLSDRVGGVLTGDYAEKLVEFEDGYFDAIVDVESLYCNSFENSRKIVEICFSKLKPGGLMFSQTFSDKTWGLEGETIGYHALLPIDGPMANKGYTRFTTKEDIDRLYKLENNFIKNVELQELHLSNGKSISEWIIEVEKN